MSKVIIECPDRLTAHAIALWFESGEAIEAFKENVNYSSVIEAGGSEIEEIPEVIFEEHSFFPEHTVYLQEI